MYVLASSADWSGFVSFSLRRDRSWKRAGSPASSLPARDTGLPALRPALELMLQRLPSQSMVKVCSGIELGLPPGSGDVHTLGMGLRGASSKHSNTGVKWRWADPAGRIIHSSAGSVGAPRFVKHFADRRIEHVPGARSHVSAKVTTCGKSSSSCKCRAFF